MLVMKTFMRYAIQIYTCLMEDVRVPDPDWSLFNRELSLCEPK